MTRKGKESHDAMRMIVELHCQRIQRKPYVPSEGGSTEPSTNYNGELCAYNSTGMGSQQRISLPFLNKDMGEVAVWAHHMIRMLSRAGVEICVKMFQKSASSLRPATVINLDDAQVNKIYKSPESAEAFFAPQNFTRKGTSNVKENK